MIPIYSRAVSILPSGAKEMVWETILPFWPLFCHLFSHYFSLVRKIDTTSLVSECSCIFAKMLNFCSNNGQFFSVGMRPHLLHECIPMLYAYASGNIKTNSIQAVSACLAFFEAIWHFLFTWTCQPGLCNIRCQSSMSCVFEEMTSLISLLSP